MKQILQIFTAIVVLTKITQASSFKVAFDAHMRLGKEDLIPNVGPDGSSQEETSPVRWKSPKQAVDLESFLSSGRSKLYVEPISFNLGDMGTQAAKQKSTKQKIVKTGVGTFFKMHYSKNTQINVATQPLTIKSSGNAQNAAVTVPAAQNTIVTAPAAQNNKRKSAQLYMEQFITAKKKNGGHSSDSEGSTDRDSLTRYDSLSSLLPSDSASSDISSEEDDAL